MFFGFSALCYSGTDAGANVQAQGPPFGATRLLEDDVIPQVAAYDCTDAW